MRPITAPRIDQQRLERHNIGVRANDRPRTARDAGLQRNRPVGAPLRTPASVERTQGETAQNTSVPTAPTQPNVSVDMVKKGGKGGSQKCVGGASSASILETCGEPEPLELEEVREAAWEGLRLRRRRCNVPSRFSAANLLMPNYSGYPVCRR